MKKTIYIFSDGELRRKDNTVYFENEEGRSLFQLKIPKKYAYSVRWTLTNGFLSFDTERDYYAFFQSLWILCRHILSEGTYEFRIYDTETGRKLSKF